MRIAWQYKKYFGEEKTSHAEHRGDTIISFVFLLAMNTQKSMLVNIFEDTQENKINNIVREWILSEPLASIIYLFLSTIVVTDT